MKVKLWGTRGSIPAAGPDTVRYGGDTAAIEIRTRNGRVVILDAGSGIRPLGRSLEELERIDIVLSHLHMDHIQGLPFFPQLLAPGVEVHIWGPVSTTRTLRERLSRYMSSPLFPVRVRELPNVEFHDLPPSIVEIDSLNITADLVSHPGETLGFRIVEGDSVIAYLPDHEPALGNGSFPGEPHWTSGFSLSENADVLIHDSQYTEEEYVSRVGWGHSSYQQLQRFATMVGAKKLVTFHHDPAHSDAFLDETHEALSESANGYTVTPGATGLTIDL